MATWSSSPSSINSALTLEVVVYSALVIDKPAIAGAFEDFQPFKV